MEHTHEYLHEHGIAHTHGEGHGHVHENTKAVLNRLARAIGHLESVKKMVEDLNTIIKEVNESSFTIFETGSNAS